MRAVRVVEVLVLAQRLEQMALVPYQRAVEEFSRTVRTQRSITAFMRGIRTPVRTTAMPLSAGTVANSDGYLPSRSRMRNRTTGQTAVVVSCRSMARLRAIWMTHAAVGWAVAPRTRMRRVVCSMTPGCTGGHR